MRPRRRERVEKRNESAWERSEVDVLDLVAMAVFDNAAEGILVIDSGLNVRLANPALCRMLNLNPEKTLGQHIFDLGPGPWNLTEIRKLLEAESPQSAPPQRTDISHVFPEVGYRDLSVTAQRLQPDQHGDASILLMIQDHTRSIVPLPS